LAVVLIVTKQNLIRIK